MYVKNNSNPLRDVLKIYKVNLQKKQKLSIVVSTEDIPLRIRIIYKE